MKIVIAELTDLNMYRAKHLRAANRWARLAREARNEAKRAARKGSLAGAIRHLERFDHAENRRREHVADVLWADRELARTRSKA